MKKQLLSLLILIAFYSASAQYDYAPTGINDVPLLGMQWGLTGTYHSAMLPNRDDQRADARLDPQMMNLQYSAGVEGIYWFERNFGLGAQFLLWNGGASYTGVDSNVKRPYSAATKLSYIKLPVLFHFKSFNRYHPNRRLRFNGYFGPYVAILNDYSDLAYYNDDKSNIYKVEGGTISGGGLDGTFEGQFYKSFELGFVSGFGIEFRLWRRTVLAISLRGDYGITDVEDKRRVKYTPQGAPASADFNPWEGWYSKYIRPTQADLDANYAVNRPASKNFSIGTAISLRKYVNK